MTQVRRSRQRACQPASRQGARRVRPWRGPRGCGRVQAVEWSAQQRGPRLAGGAHERKVAREVGPRRHPHEVAEVPDELGLVRVARIDQPRPEPGRLLPDGREAAQEALAAQQGLGAHAEVDQGQALQLARRASQAASPFGHRTHVRVEQRLMCGHEERLGRLPTRHVRQQPPVERGDHRGIVRRGQNGLQQVVGGAADEVRQRKDVIDVVAGRQGGEDGPAGGQEACADDPTGGPLGSGRVADHAAHPRDRRRIGRDAAVAADLAPLTVEQEADIGPLGKQQILDRPVPAVIEHIVGGDHPAQRRRGEEIAERHLRLRRHAHTLWRSPTGYTSRAQIEQWKREGDTEEA